MAEIPFARCEKQANKKAGNAPKVLYLQGKTA
jgi:hypothetical protein